MTRNNNSTRFSTATVLLSCMMLMPSVMVAQQASVQQTGTLTGRIVEESTGQPVIGATVMILGTKLGARTNVDGNYTIKNVPQGKYSLKVSSVGYGAKTIEGLAIDPGRTVRQDAALLTAAIQGQEVKVTAESSRQSENAALIERKRSSAVSDAISADQISRAPASDAGDAMKRVTGVSVVGSKYVVVRGLSERYSATQLNGVNLPSPEPEKKVVPFDIFPSSMISRLTTIKTFTPDNPGDFAGGLVKISTKDSPESFLLSLSVGGGMNSEAHGQDALTYNGVAGFLGTAGDRVLPGGLPVGRRVSAEQEADLLSQFGNNVFVPSTGTLPLNQSYSLAIGNRFDVGFPLGFLASGTYAGSSSYRDEEESYPLLSETGGKHDLRYNYDSRQAERSVLWGGLFSMSAELSPEHKVSLKAIYNHSADDEARIVEGLYNQSTTGDIRTTRLRFVERGLFSAQLDGEHHFEDFLDSKIDWRAAVSTASRNEPDNRTTTYFRWDDGIYRFANNFGSGNGRFFSDLDDVESNVGLDWSLPLSIWNNQSARIKVGGLGRFRDRDFSARRFIYGTNTNDETFLALSPEQLFTPENVRSGVLLFNEETLGTDSYTANERIAAGYAMVDMPLVGALRLIGGARFEQWHLSLYPINPQTGLADLSLSARRDVSDILPSLNLIYALGEDMNIRTAVTQTLARPEFRELAPFRFDDYRQSTYGNPALERTKITNYDLRWEWFPGSGEVVAVSGFYKSFVNPIEQFYLVGGSDIAVESANANNAISYGTEFEVRKSLGFIADALSNFAIGSNLTLVKSEVSFEEGEQVKVFDGVQVSSYSSKALTSNSRPLQGQSPYVINASLSYDNFDMGTSVTLLYNIFGDRLSIVGTYGIPDTYEQARGALDLTVAQRLPYGLQLKLTGRNLLDEAALQQQEFENGETIQVDRYLSGRSLSISLSFNFDQFQFQQTDMPVASSN